MSELAPITRGGWAIMWRSDNRVDGKTRHLMWDGMTPSIYRTRREAREVIERTYGYIRNRPDLQREPHGWKMPKVIRIRATYEEDCS